MPARQTVRWKPARGPTVRVASAAMVDFPATPLISAARFDEFAVDALPFCAAFGIRAVEVGSATGTMRWTYDESMIRPPDFVSGPLMMTLADASLYLALFTVVGVEPLALTNELKTNFLRPARGRDLVAQATMVTVGQRVAFGTVELWEEGTRNRLVAHATGSYIRQRPTPQMLES